MERGRCRLSRGHRASARLAVALAAAGLAGLASASTAAAVTYEPPDGRILSGAAVEYPPESQLPLFLSRTGQPNVAITHGYVGHLQSVESVLKDLRKIDAAAMVSWRAMAGTTGAKGGNLTKVAQGDIDAYLVKSAAQVRAHPRPVFIRLYWEFTGTWFPWSTYDRSNAQRPGNSPEMFRQAWRRIRIIFDGGSRAEVNQRLAKVGLPQLTVADKNLPYTKAAWVWSVSKGGVKPKDKPHKTEDYYPGDSYVDWVGQGLHQVDDLPFSHWASGVNSPDPLATVNAVYDFAVAHGKPTMLSEWAIATPPYAHGDDPDYVNDALSWLEAHPKAKGQVYFDRKMSGYSHQIINFPKARAAFTSHVNGWRYLHDWRQADGAPSSAPPVDVPDVAVPAPSSPPAAAEEVIEVAPPPATPAPASPPAPAARAAAAAATGASPATQRAIVRATLAPSEATCGGRKVTILGTGRAEVLVGTHGPDVIAGLGGDDRIVAGRGDDVICGGAGDDLISGGRGDDRISGGAGDDRILGNRGDDRIAGGSGGDQLLGGYGRDRLLGGRGHDRLLGGRGVDRLVGGKGGDKLFGGAGRDLCAGRGGC